MCRSMSILNGAPTGGKFTEMVIGVAGKYCAGKNAIVAFLEEANFTVIDVDRVGHTTLIEEKKAVAARFGPQIIGPHGEIDRRVLGEIVFRNAARLAELEKILHPAMVAKIETIVSETDGNIAVNAAILFKMGLQRLCDFVIYVTAPFCTRLRRALARDSLGFVRTMRRLLSQNGISPKFNSVDVDIYSVGNSGDRYSLRVKVENILRERCRSDGK